jgi:hypothetical protein
MNELSSEIIDERAWRYICIWLIPAVDVAGTAIFPFNSPLHNLNISIRGLAGDRVEAKRFCRP